MRQVFPLSTTDGIQNYLIFQSKYKYFKNIGSPQISTWKSKGLSNESVKPPSTSDNVLAPSLSYIGIKPKGKFVGSCLKQDKVIITYKKMVNIYIVYKINLWDRGYDD